MSGAYSAPPGASLRLDADAEDVGRGLGALVAALMEIVRELLERQAVRRMDAGSLSADEVERLGRALMALREQLAAVREQLGVDQRDVPRHLVDHLLVEDLDGATDRTRRRHA